MSAPTIDRPCFVCGSSDGEAVFRTAIDVCGLGNVSYAIRSCSGCGLTLQDPAVSPETMMRQYGMFSNYTAFSTGTPPLAPPAERMLKVLEAEGVRPGQVYDVGASTGAMLWHLRERGWKATGCDLSPKAVEQARTLNGIDLDLGSDSDGLAGRTGLDLITFSHVLEHIYDPPATLRRVHAALADDGLLMIEVPCLVAPQTNPPGLFMMEHINYFDATSLENLFTRAGFTILQNPIEENNWPFPVITVLARKQAPQPDAPIRNGHQDSSEFGRAYADVEQRIWDAVDARLRSAIEPAEEVYIWGAGLHTSTLLERTGLGQYATVLAITDRDPQKHGHQLGAYQVIEPDVVLASGRKVVVSSYVSEPEIAQALEKSGVPADRVIRPHGH